MEEEDKRIITPELKAILRKIKFKCDKVDTTLVHKPFLLNDFKEWVLQIYKQFGFDSYEEVELFSKAYNNEQHNWMNFFYWSAEVEKDFITAILMFYVKDLRKRKQVTRYLEEVSLNWSPTNELIAFERNHAYENVYVLDKEDKK